MPRDVQEITDNVRDEVVGRAELPGMSLLEHLEELRKRIIYSAVSVVGMFFVAYWFHEQMFNLMQRPIFFALKNHHLDTQLVYTAPTDAFNMYLKMAFIAAIFLASPIILYQVWLFISPGLYKHEKRYVVPFMVATVGLFIAGGFFAFKMAFPAALDFLIGYGQQFKPMITISEYTDLFLTLIIGMGIVFELPILVFFLALMGIVNARWLWKNLRYSILVIFTIAAIVTPTTDILNMCIFAAPMVALYMASIGVAWLVHPSRRKARAAKAQGAGK
ncbi:MAG TPA: twin-arginine translocase subunit TatC [Terriglobales bacterium]|nr:twin-arginine translocase subunit TatC [Terriglobales bacterium]